MISDPAPSNSSLLEFYNEVMTFNDSVVELVCCKLNGSPVSVSCGRGFSCAAACYSREAVLCPSHNCEECDNVDNEVDEGSGQRKERVKERLAWSSLFSGAMSHCTRRGCNVRGRFKYCCFHPTCRSRKRRQCSWYQYFLGKSILDGYSSIFNIIVKSQVLHAHVLVKLFTVNGLVRNNKSQSQIRLTLMVTWRATQVINTFTASKLWRTPEDYAIIE